MGQKLVENAKIQKIQMRHFESFSNNVQMFPYWNIGEDVEIGIMKTKDGI